MSDWIEVNGKKYYEESYLILANNNAKRRGEQLETARTTLENIIDCPGTHPVQSGPYSHRKMVKARTDHIERLRKLAMEALAQIGAERTGPSDTERLDFDTLKRVYEAVEVLHQDSDSRQVYFSIEVVEDFIFSLMDKTDLDKSNQFAAMSAERKGGE